MGRKRITDKERREIEKKAKEEVKEMFASRVRDVEYIEVFYRNGETEKFEHDELDTYSRTELTFEIKTKTREIIIHINEISKIIIKKYDN